jgi:hypothetical protein
MKQRTKAATNKANLIGSNTGCVLSRRVGIRDIIQ